MTPNSRIDNKLGRCFVFTPELHFSRLQLAIVNKMSPTIRRHMEYALKLTPKSHLTSKIHVNRRTKIRDHQTVEVRIK